MAKIKIDEIPKEQRLKDIGEFFNVVSDLKTKKEVVDFFVGTLTASEALILSRRMQTAKRLIIGDSYEEIKKEIGVGSTTITSVVKWLGMRDGAYKKILKKYLLKDYDFNNETREYIKKAKKNKNDKFVKNKLYKYPGYELAAKILGIEYLDKKIQNM